MQAMNEGAAKCSSTGVAASWFGDSSVVEYSKPELTEPDPEEDIGNSE